MTKTPKKKITDFRLTPAQREVVKRLLKTSKPVNLKRSTRQED